MPLLHGVAPPERLGSGGVGAEMPAAALLPECRRLDQQFRQHQPLPQLLLQMQQPEAGPPQQELIAGLEPLAASQQRLLLQSQALPAHLTKGPLEGRALPLYPGHLPAKLAQGDDRLTQPGGRGARILSGPIQGAAGFHRLAPPISAV